jgi:hypothetical protein
MNDKQKGVELVEAAYPDLRHPQPLTFTDIRKNTKLVKTALQEIMVKTVDYGTTPGCGDKPGLLKPGAEKLGMLFKIGCFPQVEDKSENGEFTYIIRTKAIHQPTGIELGEGVGAASTLEEKYAWRRAVCDEEFDQTPEERRRIKWEKPWKAGEKATSVKQVRDNPAGKQNTVLKMAAKRSMVDVIIKVTAASDIFNQGEDDIIIDETQPRQPSKPKEKPAPAPAPAGQTTQEAKPAEAEASQEQKAVVTDGVKMNSKREGSCNQCKKTIAVGSEIVWDGKAKRAYHADCVA